MVLDHNQNCMSYKSHKFISHHRSSTMETLGLHYSGFFLNIKQTVDDGFSNGTPHGPSKDDCAPPLYWLLRLFPIWILLNLFCIFLEISTNFSLKRKNNKHNDIPVLILCFNLFHPILLEGGASRGAVQFKKWKRKINYSASWRVEDTKWMWGNLMGLTLLPKCKLLPPLWSER